MIAITKEVEKNEHSLLVHCRCYYCGETHRFDVSFHSANEYRGRCPCNNKLVIVLYIKDHTYYVCFESVQCLEERA